MNGTFLAIAVVVLDTSPYILLILLPTNAATRYSSDHPTIDVVVVVRTFLMFLWYFRRWEGDVFLIHDNNYEVPEVLNSSS